MTAPEPAPDEVYAAAALAMVPLDDLNEPVLFEWRRDSKPWPAAPIRAAIDVAYLHGRDAAARDVESWTGERP